MKLKIAVIALAGVILASCGSNGPEQVATDYYAALENKDYDKAKSLATKESAQVIDLVSKAPDMGQNDSKLEKVECDVTGETALCKCFTTGETEPSELKMKKVDGDWKVSMSKMDMAGDAMEGMGDMNMEDVMNNVDAGLEQLDGAGDKLNEVMNEVKEAGGDLENKMNEVMEKAGKELEEVTK